MNSKRGRFVYTERNDPPTATPPSTGSHQFLSSRKRARSSDTSGPSINAGPSDPVFKGVVGGEFEDENDDIILAAALEDYELTQQQPLPFEPHEKIGLNRGTSPDISSLPAQQTGYPYNTTVVTPSSVPAMPLENQDLQDRLITIEGEIKILRLENKNLKAKINQHDRDVYEETLSRKTEQESRESKLSKQINTLQTECAFKDKEMNDIKHENQKLKEAMRQQNSKDPFQNGTGSSIKRGATPPKSVGSSSRIKTSSNKSIEFPSSVDFIPTSQISGSNIIHVKKKRSHSSSSTQSDFTSRPSSSTGTPKIDRESQTELITNDASLVLHNSYPTEMTGAQLLRLLMQRDLLSIPDYKTLELRLEKLDEPPETMEVLPPFGLLSLLQASIPTHSPAGLPSTPDSVSTTPMVTPINNRCHPHYKTSYRLLGRGINSTPPSSMEYPRIHSLKRTLTLDSDNDRSFSSTCTPSLLLTKQDNSTLSFEHSIASLLGSSDLPVSSSHKMPHFSLESLSFTQCSKLNPISPDNGVSLLPVLESVIVNYYQDKLLKQQKNNSDSSSSSNATSRENSNVNVSSSSGSSCSSSNTSSNTSSNASSNASSMNTDPNASIMSTLLLSPQTSEGFESQSSSHSSHTSDTSQISQLVTSEEPSPHSVIQKEQVLQVAYALETLCKYSQQVRDALLLRPPKFNINRSSSELPSSSEELSENELMDTGEVGDDHSELARIKDKTSFRGCRSKEDTISQKLQQSMTPEQPKYLQDFVCLNTLGYNVSNRVLIRKEQIQKEEMSGHSHLSPFNSVHYPFHSPSYTGSLFDTLLDLVTVCWKEDLELVISVLDSLTSLALDCSKEFLERYSVLLKQKCVLVSLLLLENPELTLKVVTLLLPLSRSSEIVQLLCNNSNSCLLDHCYALYAPRVPVKPTEVKINIGIQLTRFLFQLTTTEVGQKVLFDSEECCSHQLLKSLVSCLTEILEELKNKQTSDDKIISKQRSFLANQIVRFLHVICQKDKHFLEHKSDCFYSYIFCLMRSYELFRGTFVGELLQYLFEVEGIDIEELEEDEEEEMTSANDMEVDGTET